MDAHFAINHGHFNNAPTENGLTQRGLNFRTLEENIYKQFDTPFAIQIKG